VDSHLYTELFRIGAAATDVGALDWAKRFLTLPGAVALVFAVLGRPQWLARGVR